MADLIQTRTSLVPVTEFELAGALDADEAMPSDSCSLDDLDQLETLIVAMKTHRDALRPTPTKRSS